MAIDQRRSELLRAYQDSRAELLAAIDGLSDEQMNEPAADGWSIKDHLAHVVHMDELRSFEIGRVSQGYQAAYPPTTPEQWDPLNATGVELRRPMSVQQVLWELEFTRARVLEAIQSATERGLEQPHYGEISLEGGAPHELEHAAAIRRVRGSRGL